MQVISSKANEQIKHIKKLFQKKYREEYSEFVIEGIKIVKEALAEKVNLKSIYINEQNKDEILREIPEIEKMNISIVENSVFSDISDVVNPQGIIAIVEKASSNKISYDEKIFLILDGISDPGNMGTIIRTADSLNMKQIIVSKNTLDIYNPKVVRSTMGAIFRVNVIYVEDLVKEVENLKSKGIKVYSTDLRTDKSIYSINYENSAIVIGNESNGVSREVLDASSDRIKIPMNGKTESLNAAVATSIVLYEANRALGLIK